MSAGSKDRNDLKAALRRCHEQNAASFEYLSCKSEILRNFKQNPQKDQESFKKEMELCRKEWVQRSFPGPDVLPVWLNSRSQVFFAGAGMNEPIPIDDLQPSGYDCQPMKSAFLNPKGRDYFLFGNRIQDFKLEALVESFKKLTAVKRRQMLANSSKPSMPIATDKGEWVQIAWEPVLRSKDRRLSAYVASAPCEFRGDLGKVFEGASMHYMMDAESRQAIPYFGVVFYQTNSPASKMSTRGLAAQLAQRLGSSFQVQENPESDLLIVGESRWEHFDFEGDPTDVCKETKNPPHRFLGVLKSSTSSLESPPSYFLLASVANLCEYGRLVGNRVLVEQTR